MLQLVLGLALILFAPAASADALDASRSTGAVLLMRHATAPGTGDPTGMRLGECSTQRNLSDAGRQEARDIGARLRAAGITFDHVLASEWCRTTDTATLMDVGPVTAFPPANSFFGNREDADRQTAEVLAHLETLSPKDRVLIVTHQVNITALTGIVPQSGEIIVTRRDGGNLTVVDRMPPG